MVKADDPRAEAPPLSPRLSKTLAELPQQRDSWPDRLRAELAEYVTGLRERGMTPERSLATIKQVARPLFEHSDKLSGQVVNWVLDAYYGHRTDNRNR